MEKIRQSDDNRFIPMTSLKSGQYVRVNDEVHYYTQQIVNVVFIEDQSTGNWVLVDAGMPMGGSKLIDVAKKHFGTRKPSAILLTHGHFDHVGSIKHLIEEWNVPAYAHPEEFPFLTGSQAYPEPDNTVEGGMLAKLSSIYPIEPVDISAVLQPLPADGSVPFLKDWRWLHVPGHSPGQVAFYHDAEKLLVSGDAIITVRQDAMYKVLLQKQEVCGPPVYLTTDWQAAELSVRKLAALGAECLVPGHGQFMHGPELTEGLATLVSEFRERAVPAHGKWV